MCKAFLGSPQYDDINDDVLVNSEHEIFDLSTSDESPLVDFCDLAAPKEVSFHSHRFTFTAAKFSTTCVRI